MSDSAARADCDADCNADRQAREAALDPRRSIVLQAPAGSGKTTVLTQRFLRVLCQVEQPEQVLAITFTRKAAAEMRARILRALRGEEATRPGETDWGALARERSHARQWALETHPGRLRIQTIDSLNRVLAAQLPLSARAAGDLEILEQPQELYRTAARRTLLDAERDAGLQQDIDLLFDRLDNDFGRAERLLVEMLRARSHWLPLLLAGSDAELPARVDTSMRALVSERLAMGERLLARALIVEGASIGCAAAHARALTGDTRPGAWRSWGATPPAVLALEHWQALAQLALTGEGTWRVNLTRREGISAEDPVLKARALDWLRALSRIDGARELLQEIALLPGPRLPAEDAEALCALARLLRLAASELELVFQESARVDFAYVAAAARQALTEESAPTDLALRVGDDLQHILVDEFQDTSIEQCALLEALTAGWEQGDGRTLFLVGDPMQSIYQFREAEVGLFLRVARHGLGRIALEPLALTRNFRAQPTLVDWANRIFPRCFPQLDDPRTSAVSFRRSLAACEARGGAVCLHDMPEGDPDAEARAITRLIVQLRASAPQSSTAILLSAKSHAAPIVASLRTAGVPLCGVDLSPLGEKSVVRDLASLARALDHLGDRTAWLAVLRAPWCGLTLQELSGLGEQHAHRTVWEWLDRENGLRGLDGQARARLTRTRGVLAQSLRERARLPLSRLVERTWLRLGGPAACRDDEDLEHAHAFLAALARWSGEPDWTGPLTLEERLEGLWASEAAASDAVQVMTIHRAKGLEFDHVIVPGLSRTLSAATEPLLRWLELPRDARGSDLLMAAIAPAGRREPLSDYIKSLQERRAAHERARLLYVAATRARTELHLFAERPVANRGKAAAPTARTLLAALWPGIATEFGAGVPQPAEPTHAGAVSKLRVPRERLAAAWERPADLQDVSAESMPMRALEATEERAELRETALPHVAAEDVVCTYLKRCARRSERPRASPQITAGLEEGLRRLGLEGAALEAGVGQARTMLEACLRDGRLEWIFSREHVRGEGALELSGSLAGELAHVRVDRTFVDESGVRWAVSFRRLGAPRASPLASAEPRVPQMSLFGASQTDSGSDVGAIQGPHDRSPESAERFAEPRTTAALERAQRELAGYRAFARALGPEPVRVGVYFPARCLWVEPPAPEHASGVQGTAKTNS